MYRLNELESLFACLYPQKISNETQDKRRADITALQGMIRDSIERNDLEYGRTEERLQIFETQSGEKVYIQYPGKESKEEGAKCRPYDFRPRIKTSDGILLRDLVFADMWGLIEELNHQNHQMLKLLACIFFRLGRMMLHRHVEKECLFERIDAFDNVVENGTREISWYELSLNEEEWESINFISPSLSVDDHPISLEAFLCFFELLLQNEDSKYYYQKKDLSSGRIPTSDSMLLLSSNLYGITPTSVLLQRFVSGFGVARCLTNEIEPATEGLVHIVDRKNELKEFLDNRDISNSSNPITVSREHFSVLLKTPRPKVALITADKNDAKTKLESRGWTVYTLDELTSEERFNSLLALFEA